MVLAEGSKALTEFKRFVAEGLTIRRIREAMGLLGYNLKAYTDVELIRLWRKYA